MRRLAPETLRGDNRTCCYFHAHGNVTPLTYDGLLRGSAAYAAAYEAAGLTTGDVVLIALPHSLSLLYAWLGAIHAGCVPSFLPPPTPKQDPALYWSSHRELFERIATGAIVTFRANAEDVARRLNGLAIALLIAEDVRGDDTIGARAPRARTPADIALLQHSSGTTGLKKGVALTVDAIDRQIDAYAASIGLGADDCIVSWLPLYHDMGLIACLVLPLVRRVPIVWIDPFEWVSRPAMLFEAIAAHRGTLVWLPNFAFHHLVRTVSDEARVDLSGVRAFINCSEPCKPETFDLFARRFATWGVRADQLQVCYAMAEAVFAITQTPMKGVPRRLQVEDRLLLSVGAPIADWRVRIVDADGHTRPDGSIGEVAIAGGSLFSGYHRLPAETERKFRDGWYLTGDLGCWQDGALFITGRVDDLIITHGKNVYAHDVELAASRVPGVKPGRVVAIGQFIAELGTQELFILAESELSEPPPERERALVRAIKSAIVQEIGVTPRTVQIVQPGALIKTTSGKISRVENLRKFAASRQTPSS